MFFILFCLESIIFIFISIENDEGLKLLKLSFWMEERKKLQNRGKICICLFLSWNKYSPSHTHKKRYFFDKQLLVLKWHKKWKFIQIWSAPFCDKFNFMWRNFSVFLSSGRLIGLKWLQKISTHCPLFFTKTFIFQIQSGVLVGFKFAIKFSETYLCEKPISWKAGFAIPKEH